MFDRFTGPARKAMGRARDAANRHDHDYIDGFHLLLGILDGAEGFAIQALKTLGIDLDALRRRADELEPPGEGRITGQIPFTKSARTAVEAAFLESQDLGHNYLGTEHLLLGLLRSGDQRLAPVFEEFRLSADLVRRHVIQLLEPSDHEGSEVQPEVGDWTHRIRKVKELGIVVRDLEAMISHAAKLLRSGDLPALASHLEAMDSRVARYRNDFPAR